jgi:hypothetical protein
MRKSMTYPIRFWAVVLIILLALQFSAKASADSCKYEKDIYLTLDVADSQSLVISAAAGELEVIGVSATDEAVISGKACVSKEEWLEKSVINTETGKRARIAVELPQASGWSFTGGVYAMIHLKVEVPENLPLDIRDSSGEMFLKNIAAVEIRDSSGEIDIEDARGAVAINDSSGDIDIEGAGGDVTIESDSSGGIYARDINGSFLVVRDSSGDIRVSHVSEDVVVERDSSGDIRASDVGGDFRVLKDGSGDIVANGVEGEVDIPSKH